MIAPHEMRTGCPDIQGGAYPAFQHQRNVGAVTSSLDNNVVPVPVVHPANGIHHNMVATPYSEELRVAYSPVQWQQGNTHLQQNFQGLCQLESQASTGFQRPKLGDSACSPRNSRRRISRKANAHFYSSAQMSAQHSSYCGTSSNENSARQSVYIEGQESECSKQKGSNLNINTGQQQRHLNFAFSVGTSSLPLQGDDLDVITQTFPLQNQCSSVPMCKQLKSRNPLLLSLLRGNVPDFKFFTSPPSTLSEETNAKIKTNTSTPFSGERQYKSQQMKNSIAGHNSGKTRTQNLDYSGGTPSTPCQQQVSSPSPSSQPSTEKVSPFGEMAPPTDEQIQDFIAQQVAYYRSILTQQIINQHFVYSNEGLDKDSTLQSDCTMRKSNSPAQIPTTSASNQEDVERQSLTSAVMEQCTTGSKANTELTPKSKETGDCATSASKKHSTGTLSSVIGYTTYCPRTESVKTSLPSDFDLSVKKHLDVTVSANSDSKLVYSGD